MKARLIRLLSMANIPIRYRYATLNNYLIEKQNKVQFEEAKTYCQDILEEERDSVLSQGFSACHENLIIIGNVGIGKTRFAVSILRHFIEQGVEGVFYRISELLRTIKDSFDNQNNGSCGTKLIDRYTKYLFWSLMILVAVAIHHGLMRSWMTSFQKGSLKGCPLWSPQTYQKTS